MTITNEDGTQSKDTLTYERQDFWTTTSNKQLNFIQHVRSMLKADGKAAVVVPDNVLFEGGAGETVRKRLLESRIKGAQATAALIFLARTKNSKKEIKEFVEKTFHYNLNLDIEDLRKNYQFNESCQDTVPQAIFTFLVSDSFEDSIRKAIYIGGDSDTLAAINGSIAEAFYGGVPEEIKSAVYKGLDVRLKNIIDKFVRKFMNSIY